MTFESDIFRKMRPSITEMKTYGFRQTGTNWLYKAPLHYDDFMAEVCISSDYHVSGRVLDAFEEEYIPVKLSNQNGAYVSKIRELYINLLEDIAQNCFEPAPYINDQTNRIHTYILKKYNMDSESIFAKSTDCGIYRHDGDNKCFAMIQTVNASVFGKNNKECEILTLKVYPEDLDILLTRKGIYPAYNMNKKNWISIITDDQCSDFEIFNLIDRSFGMTQSAAHNSNAWIIPSNPKIFDIDAAFAKSELLYWHASMRMKKGDAVYIYYGAPYSEIRYKCRIIKTGIHKADESRTLMQIRKVYCFHSHLLDREMMKMNGVTAVRSARFMPEQFIEEIDRIYPDQKGL